MEGNARKPCMFEVEAFGHFAKGEAGEIAHEGTRKGRDGGYAV